MADGYSKDSIKGVNTPRFTASKLFWSNAQQQKLDVENFHVAFDGKGLVFDSYFEPNGRLKSDSTTRQKIFDVQIPKDGKSESDWANRALKKFWFLQFKTPGVTILESQAIKNWLQKQDKIKANALTTAEFDTLVDNTTRLSDDINKNIVPAINNIMNSAWASPAIEQEKDELISLLTNLNPTAQGKDIINNLFDNKKGWRPVVDYPFIYVKSGGKRCRYLADSWGDIADRGTIANYFNYFVSKYPEIDLRHEPRIYIGILFKRSYSDHNYEIECELNSSNSNFSDRFKVEVPLRSIAFDQNKAVTLHDYLQNNDLDQSILLSEFDLNGKKTDIAFDWRDESAWIQFFADVFEEAMNEISDYYSHIDSFNANETEYIKKEQEKQDKADQELRVRIAEDDKFAKEGYDHIQVKVNNDQQPDADFINKLNDISKQAKADADKEAAEWADTNDGSSGAAYTGKIKSGAAKLARYLRDCHFSVDGEEWDPSAHPGVRLTASTNWSSADWSDLESICVELITDSGFATSKVKFIKD